jgi:hypothetical protein
MNITKINEKIWSYRKQTEKFAKATTNMLRQVQTKWAGGKSRIQNKYRLCIPALIAIENMGVMPSKPAVRKAQFS